MKTQKSKIGILLFMFAVAAVALPTVAHAQSVRQISGTVIDENKSPMIGVTVFALGTQAGTTTDINGSYSFLVPAESEQLEFSFIGYQTQICPMSEDRTAYDVQLIPEAQSINDVIVVGYGTQKKSDLTGSVATVSEKDFNGGLISSPEQLINGKVAGVQIMSASGSPTSGSTIRIRGGASLNASNDPLIVLDGVPLESGGISGNNGNFLSLINPNDIESMTVLKDASSTAIYGSRASNGVLLITTKKGSGKGLKVSLTSTNSLQWHSKLPPMLSYDNFVDLASSQGYSDLIGSARTDWNKAIYRLAYGSDNNVSISGRIADNWPVRASIGYYNQDGVLWGDNAERYTGNISVSPTFFDDHLKLNVSIKGAINNNRFAPTGAIWNATTFNPTLSVYSGSDLYGGFTEILSDGRPNPNAVRNPVGLLHQTDDTSTVKRVIGNIDVDYRLHFLPDMRLHVTAGYDYATGEGVTRVSPDAASHYSSDESKSGLYKPYGPSKNTNRLFTAYLNYNKEIASLRSHVDATLGYDYQYWRASSPAGDSFSAAGESLNAAYNATDQRHALLSYYGRLNYTYDSRYMLTATLRRDGTSRFAKSSRWGMFPSVAMAWRASQESFLRNVEALSNLKLRASYGVTGQQDGIGNYSYLPVYTPGIGSEQYPSINGGTVGSWIPSAYVSDLKWETTRSYNAGLDFGLFNNRISGSVDYYYRKTQDLLAKVPTPAGTNFDREITTNVGNMSSSGLEASLNIVPIDNKNWTWNVGMNMTWQRVKITNLTLVDNAEVTRTLVGPMIDNKYVQVMTEGQSPYSFYVYKQLYDERGKPIEGAYADLNNDGKINADDRYCYHSPAADVLMGFTTSVRWKKLTLSTSLRASIGNYVYNAMAANTGALETMRYSAPQLNNLSASYLKTGFASRQFYSDYYVENASFLKMDNLTLSYDFGRVFANSIGLRASLMMQNVFTITKYSGADPEVPSGFDSAFYPRPRIVSLSLGFDF